jgi:hypothetical protein
MDKQNGHNGLTENMWLCVIFVDMPLDQKFKRKYTMITNNKSINTRQHLIDIITTLITITCATGSMFALTEIFYLMKLCCWTLIALLVCAMLVDNINISTNTSCV